MEKTVPIIQFFDDFSTKNSDLRLQIQQTHPGRCIARCWPRDILPTAQGISRFNQNVRANVSGMHTLEGGIEKVSISAVLDQGTLENIQLLESCQRSSCM